MQSLTLASSPTLFVDNDIAQAQITGRYPEQKRAAKVYIGNQPYPLSLSGPHPAHIAALLPSLTHIAIDSGKIVKVEFITPQELYGNSYIKVDGARALKQFLQQALQGKMAEVVTLSITAEQHPYIYGKVFSGSLEHLPSIFQQITPAHLSAIKHIELTMTPCSALIIEGLYTLLKKGCLQQLETLQIGFSPALLEISEVHKLYAEDHHLALLYEAITTASLPNLRSLTALMWCKLPSAACLNMINRMYSQLNSLTIYRAEMDKTLVAQRTAAAALNPLGLIFSGISDAAKGRSPTSKSLAETVAQYAETGRLTQFTVSDWNTQHRGFIAADEMQTYCQANHLRYLTTYTPSTDTLDIPSLRHDLLQALYLTRSETHGFPAWLMAIGEGRFPALTYLYYCIPSLAENEARSTYQTRVEELLAQIGIAVTNGHLPKFAAFIIDEPIDPMFADTVRALETQALKWCFTRQMEEKELIKK